MDHTNDFRETTLEAQIEAAFGAHDIGHFESVETIVGGYEAKCKL